MIKPLVSMLSVCIALIWVMSSLQHHVHIQLQGMVSGVLQEHIMISNINNNKIITSLNADIFYRQKRHYPNEIKPDDQRVINIDHGIEILASINKTIYHKRQKGGFHRDSADNINKHKLFHRDVANTNYVNRITFKAQKYNMEKVVQSNDDSVHSLKSNDLKYMSSNIEIGQDSSMPFMIFVHSSLQNFELRSAIRDTWGSMQEQIKHNFKLKFLVGLSNNGDYMYMTSALEAEMVQYQDVVLLNIIDSYQNLTLKSLAMLDWCLKNCDIRVKYVVKMDDDVFLNIPHLKSKVQLCITNKNTVCDNKEFVMVGHVIENGEPIRERHSKYYMPPTLYKHITYPPYLSGSAYTIPTTIIPDLLWSSSKFQSKYLWLEDVFITGILPKMLDNMSVRLRHEDGFNVSKKELKNILAEVCKDYNITIHELTGLEIREIWAILNDKCL